MTEKLLLATNNQAKVREYRSLFKDIPYEMVTPTELGINTVVSEVGESPLKVTSIIMAVRTFPIRVEGNSGPLKNEISWGEVRRLSGYPYEIHEFTTVTGRLRRVARFDIDLVKRATVINRPTAIAVHGVDYLDFANKGVRTFRLITDKTKDYLDYLESELSVPISIIGTGPEQNEIIDLAHDSEKAVLAKRSKRGYESEAAIATSRSN